MVLPRACTATPIVMMMTLVAGAIAAEPARRVERPTLPEVTTFAAQFLQHKTGHQPGHLVTQTGVIKLLDALEAKGWRVREREKLIARVLKDDDYLVRQFSDEAGQAFLRKIEHLPGGIDRVDRLARLPQGEMSVNDLIRKVPNGAEWIEAMTTTRRGEIEGERLSNAEAGHNFNEPTGRLYTVQALAQAIFESLEPTSRRGSTPDNDHATGRTTDK
jgi:hypothetical protein